jgi:hypothetical protein
VASFAKNWRVLAAILIAAGLVFGAYIAALSTAHPPSATASTETELLQAIATRDSDGDGLPDWEEALYGTDPNLVDTNGLGITDGEAVAKGLIIPKAVADIASSSGTTGQTANELGLPSPEEGSLTDIFAKNFFTLYLSTKQDVGRDLTQEETLTIASQSLTQLVNSVEASPNQFSSSQLKVSGSGEEALKTYEAALEAVYAAHASSLPKSELQYLEDALEGDGEALKNIETIALAYTNIATGFIALIVPQEVGATHLALTNAAAEVGRISADFARINTDPLSTMLALMQYKDAVRKLSDAVRNVDSVLSNTP